jgi:hypothetical protein
MLTVPHALGSPGAKSSAWDGRILAVEMEAYPIAVWAHAHSLPFMHARAVLDAANESLPDFGDAVDRFARPHWIRLARRIVSEPGMITDLVQLARRARAIDPVLRLVARSVALGW